MPGPTLGTNLADVVDFTSQFPFLNHFLTSRSWFTQSGNTFNTRQINLVDLDDEGWVRALTKDGSDAPFEKVSTLLFTDNQSVQPGRYIIDFIGEGTVQIAGGNGTVITQESANRYTVDIPEGFTSSTLRISILDTDPNDAGNYLRDFRVFRDEDEAALDAGEIFGPEFLEKIEDFRALRFMNWQATTDNDEVDWADRREVGDARYTISPDFSSGVPIEVMVALANEVRADPWFSIPHQATDDYVRQFATFVRDNLGEGLVARFEFSNEVWNPSYEQYHWAVAKAEADLGLDAADIPQAARQAYGIRAAEIAHIVADVFGAETGTRALNVFGTQHAFLTSEQFALNAASYVAAGYDAPRDAPFHVYAVAPYVGNGLGAWQLEPDVALWMTQGDQGIRNAIDYLRTGTVGETLQKMVTKVGYHANIAEGLGWQLEAYEAGQHMVDRLYVNGQVDPNRVAFFDAVTRHPEFAALYTEYFETWRDNGGGLMAHFTDIRQPSQYGSLGLWDTVYSANTPRVEALIDWRDNQPIYWNDDRPASTFEPQDVAPFTFGTPGADTVGLRPTDDRYDALGGNDSINGGLGNDSILGGDGSDTLGGHDGNDTLIGGAGGDRLIGLNGDDSLIGDSGNDYFIAGAGNDTINGGAGLDLIRGGAGNDVITDLIDVARVFADSGHDLVTTGDANDVILGDDGNDTIFAGGGDDRVDGGDDDDLIDAGAGADEVKSGRGNDSVLGNDGDDRLLGSVGNDTLDGGDGNDRLIGEAGDDVLRGGLGDDRFTGSVGNDVMEGGAGNDLFRDGFGNDTIIGGTGDDTIELSQNDDLLIFRLGDGVDLVRNFDRYGDDVLRFEGFGAAFDTASEVLAAAQQLGNNVRIDFGGGQTITFERLLLSDLGVDDILFG